MANPPFFVTFTKIHKKLTQKGEQCVKMNLYKIVSTAETAFKACKMSAGQVFV